MLEVFPLQQCNVVNYVGLCAELHASRNAQSENNLGKEEWPDFRYKKVFGLITYTSNMAACCVSEVTAPHV